MSRGVLRSTLCVAAEGSDWIGWAGGRLSMLLWRLLACLANKPTHNELSDHEGAHACMHARGGRECSSIRVRVIVRVRVRVIERLGLGLGLGLGLLKDYRKVN